MLTLCQYKFAVLPRLFFRGEKNKQPSKKNGCLSHLSQKCDHCFAGFPCLYSACKTYLPKGGQANEAIKRDTFGGGRFAVLLHDRRRIRGSHSEGEHHEGLRFQRLYQREDHRDTPL